MKLLKPAHDCQSSTSRDYARVDFMVPTLISKYILGNVCFHLEWVVANQMVLPDIGRKGTERKGRDI